MITKFLLSFLIFILLNIMSVKLGTTNYHEIFTTTRTKYLGYDYFLFFFFFLVNQMIYLFGRELSTRLHLNLCRYKLKCVRLSDIVIIE